ncbi:hypothetical protein DFP72DRAFT_523098 [Ephemerocybe angulata]|uniref:Uncharacterized protein n=1 Tax=Ephemerocybe angulata TaxID=980116 RepID=A0A8H6MC71_9AGAR|nr:hypothetical protein DFP72DRAFT_523098 [Tulosesus angulatus]
MSLPTCGTQANGTRLSCCLRVSRKPGRRGPNWAVLPTDSKPSLDSKNVRDVIGDLAPERFHDDLRAYLATHLLPTKSSTLEKDDDNSVILSYMAKFEALVEEHMGATGYKKRDCAAESSQDPSDAANPVSQDDVAEGADSRTSGDGESMGHSVAPTMLSDQGIPTLTQVRCEDESDTPPSVSLTSFSAGAPDLELPSKLSDAPALTSSATCVHPRSDTQRSLIASTKHWVTLVANILVISWTVVFFVIYISPSFGNGSFRLPS